MTQENYRLNREAGYNLVEMMLVMGLMAILSGMAVLQINASRPGLKADGGMRVVLGRLNQARELAITQRRFMRVTFTNPNQVAIVREDTTTTTTTISTVLLEGGVTYSFGTGVPDTPEHFGMNSATYFGSVTNVKFTPDGQLVNQDGVSANGTVFLSISGIPRSARAITIFGSTGRVRGYKWDGKNWNVV